MIEVNEPLCTGCGICVELCPSNAIHLRRGIAVIDQAECTECETCLEACPQGAIFGVSERTEEKVPLPAKRPLPEVIHVQVPQIAAAQPVAPARTGQWAGVLPAVAGALALVGRQLPRVLPAVLDALERRTATPPAATNRSPTRQPAAGSRSAGGQRRRRRRGGGGR